MGRERECEARRRIRVINRSDGEKGEGEEKEGGVHERKTLGRRGRDE